MIRPKTSRSAGENYVHIYKVNKYKNLHPQWLHHAETRDAEQEMEAQIVLTQLSEELSEELSEKLSEELTEELIEELPPAGKDFPCCSCIFFLHLQR